MKSLFYTFLFLLASQSCGTSQDNEKSQTEQKSLIRKQLVLPVGAMTSNAPHSISFLEEKGKEFLYVPDKTNKLLVYDLTQREVVNEVTLHKTGPNAIGHDFIRAGFTVINTDSILVGIPIENRISLINSKGELLFKFDKLQQGFDPYQLLTENYTPIIFWENKASIIAKKEPICWAHKPNVFNGKELFSFSLEDTSKYTLSGICAVDNRYFAKAYHAPMIAHHSYCSPEEGTIIHSFPASPEINIVSTQGNTKSFLASSSYFEEAISHTVEEAEKMKEESLPLLGLQHFRITGFYASIIYDKYKKQYYRIAMQPQDKEVTEHTPFYDVYFNKPFSIIVLDENFQKIKETPIIEDVFNPYLYFVNSEGLWICKNSQADNLDEDKMVFELFEL